MTNPNATKMVLVMIFKIATMELFKVHSLAPFHDSDKREKVSKALPSWQALSANLSAYQISNITN